MRDAPGPRALRCIQCGEASAYVDPFQRCDACGSDWLDPLYDYDRLPRAGAWIDASERSLWRYRALLPLRARGCENSLQEGWTPLLPLPRFGASIGLDHLLVKDEGRNPTGSFKDRQASLVTSILQEQGVGEVALCSTGNVAMAYAAYCARVDIRLVVFLPAMVPRLKERLVRGYGAEVHRLDASYYESRRIAKARARERGILYDPGADNFINRESKKTIAFEIAEQLGWRAPDWYVQAVNGGPGPMGVSKGFDELRALGLIDRVPKIACVQSDRCSPMVDAFLAGRERATAVEPHTRIVTLSYESPGYSYALLSRLVSESGGTMVKVDEDRAFARLGELARSEGLVVAPAAAVALEGAAKLRAEGIIAPHERVVVNLSGAGVFAHEVFLGP